MTIALQGIKVIYFEKEEFPEMDDFMNETSETLGFEFRRYTVSYREGMEDLVKNHNVKVCFDPVLLVLKSHLKP